MRICRPGDSVFQEALFFISSWFVGNNAGPPGEVSVLRGIALWNILYWVTALVK